MFDGFDLVLYATDELKGNVKLSHREGNLSYFLTIVIILALKLFEKLTFFR